MAGKKKGTKGSRSSQRGSSGSPEDQQETATAATEPRLNMTKEHEPLARLFVNAVDILTGVAGVSEAERKECKEFLHQKIDESLDAQEPHATPRPDASETSAPQPRVPRPLAGDGPRTTETTPSSSPDRGAPDDFVYVKPTGRPRPKPRGAISRPDLPRDPRRRRDSLEPRAPVELRAPVFAPCAPENAPANAPSTYGVAPKEPTASTSRSRPETALLSPTPPKCAAQDSPAKMMSACFSPQESDMSASEYEIEAEEADRRPTSNQGRSQEANQGRSQVRPQRRPRSPEDDDALEEAKRRPQQRTPPPAAAAAPGPNTAKKKPRCPPLVVERLPDWQVHFKALRDLLGRPPTARPYQAGIRFLPVDEVEYRVVQKYLCELEKTTGLSWFSYSLPAERKFKVAIRGLPVDTEPEEIMEELRRLDYDPEYVRSIRGRQGRPGCIFHAVLNAQRDIRRIYDTSTFLMMGGVRIEAWRGKQGPAQCHRCQQFRHSSHQCHRPLACVRCGQEHAARDCPRPRAEPATCANCGGPHPASHRECPAFRREVTNRRAGTVALTASRTTRPVKAATNAEDHEAQGATLMAVANGPSERGEARARKRRRKRGSRKGKEPPPPPPSSQEGTAQVPQPRATRPAQAPSQAWARRKTEAPAAAATDSTAQHRRLGDDTTIRVRASDLLRGAARALGQEGEPLNMQSVIQSVVQALLLLLTPE